MKFTKYDNEKLRYDLIPAIAEEEVVKILTYGANKYADNNWRQVDNLDRYVAACLRHLARYRKGEKLDEESGLPHLAHACTNLMFLLELSNNEGSTV